MGKVVKLYPKPVRDKLAEFGVDPAATIKRMSEIESIWDLPVEERQAAYDALKAKYGAESFCMSGPGIVDVVDDIPDDDGE